MGQPAVQERREGFRTLDRGLDQPLARPHELAHRDGVDPRHELGPAFERAEVRDDPDQDLLTGVLGVLGMAEEAQRQPVDRVLYLLDQPRERVGVARRRSLRELL
jgi:hypothetical protein